LPTGQLPVGAAVLGGGDGVTARRQAARVCATPEGARVV